MKVNKLLLAAFAAVAVLASCSKEDGVNSKTSGADVPEGIPTYANFSFDVEGADTKAAVALPAEGSEAATISDIRVLIFKNTASSTVCEVNKLVNAQSSSAILLTSGVKKIFVIANAATQTAINSALDETIVIPGTTTLNDFYTSLSQFKLGAVTSPFNTTALNNLSLLSLLTTADKMVYSNAADTKSTYTLAPSVSASTANSATASGNQADDGNHFQIKVKRVVAKAKVVYESTLLSGADKLKAGGTSAEPDGLLQDFSYSIRNVRRYTYLVQQFRGGDEVDPTAPIAPAILVPYDAVTSADLAFADYRPYLYSQSGEPNGDLKYAYGTNNLKVKNDAGAVAYYMPENINGTARWGNTTWAPIQATFLPQANKYVATATYDNVGGNNRFTIILGTTAITSPTTLYRTKIGGTNLPVGSIFVNKTQAYQAAYSLKFPDKLYSEDATDFADFSDEDKNRVQEVLDTYNAGVCYYQLFFGEGDNSVPGGLTTGVKRNYSYTAVIKKFAGIGTPEEDGGTDPGTPLETSTNVNVTIEVMPWTTIESGHIL